MGASGRVGRAAAVVGAALLIWPAAAGAVDRISLLDHAPPGTQVDRTGNDDASRAPINAVLAANAVTATGGPACIYIPPGTYRIVRTPPGFARAGCVKGDGSTQSTLLLDPAFAGDLLTWSEAWVATTPGPVVVGLRIVGSRGAKAQQNALVFYDRNDNVFLDDVTVNDVPARALYVVTGPTATNIPLDGRDVEAWWTYHIHRNSRQGLLTPLVTACTPALPGPDAIVPRQAPRC